LGRRRGVNLAFLPPELDLATHLGARGDREAAGLEVAGEGSGFLQLDPALGDDVAANLAADQHGVGLDLAVDRRAGLDGELTLDVDVALEAPGAPDVSVPLDLALDRETRGQEGFRELGLRDRHGLLLPSQGLSRDGLRRRHGRLHPGFGAGRWLVLPGLLSEQCHDYASFTASGPHPSAG